MSGKNGKISYQQLIIILFIALLAPVIRIIPKHSIEHVGVAGWIAPLFSVIPNWILLWVAFRLMKDRKEGENMADVLCQTFGRQIGRVLCFIYLIWIIFLISVAVRMYGERFLATTHSNQSLEMFVFVLMAIVYFAVRGSVENFARAGEVYFIIIGAVFTGIIVFSLFNVKEENVLPVTYHDILPSLKTAFSSMGVYSVAGLLFFMMDNVAPDGKENRKSRMYLWTGILCVVSAAIVFTTSGSFGENMIQRLQAPFFSMIKGIKVLNVFERMEAVIVAIWVITDFMLVTMLVIISGKVGKTAFGLSSDKVCITPVVILSAVGALTVASTAFDAEKISAQIIQPGNVIITAGVFAAALIVKLLREKIVQWYEVRRREEEENG